MRIKKTIVLPCLAILAEARFDSCVPGDSVVLRFDTFLSHTIGAP